MRRQHRCDPPRLRWSRGGAGARGDGPVEMAILALPMLIITFTVAQTGLYFYARSVALGAATHGANVARSYDAAYRGDGVKNARLFLDIAGEGLITGTPVQKTTATTVTVTVTSDIPSIIPFVHFTVSQSATRPIERTTT